MQIIEHEGLKIELDDEDYLINFENWNEKVAHLLAERQGVNGITEEVMEIINFFREYYRKFNSFPVLRHVCKNINQPENCFIKQFIDPLKVWKISGLPKPPGEVMAYLSYYQR